MRKELLLLALLAVLCAALAALNPRFLSAENLQNTARLVGIYGIFSLGAGLVIMTGGIDLSVGSLFALLGLLLVFALVPWGWPWPVAVAALLAAAALLGLAHGFLVAHMGLQPFLVTLCGLLLYRGLARFLAREETRGFGYCHGFADLQRLATGNLLGAPLPFLYMLIAGIAAWVAVHHSPYGRHLLAVGANPAAACLSGLRVRRLLLSAYALSALLAGVSAVLLAFYTNSVSPSTHGNFLELYAIAAAVLGGCSLRGGEGSVPGILLGAVLLQVLQNLVNLLGIPSALNFAVMGAVILLGVVADQALRRR